MTAPLEHDILEQTQIILRRDLKLGETEPLPADKPLFGGDLDLDSLDLLLLVTSIEKHFGVRIPNPAMGKEVFETVGSLARYIQANRGRAPSAPIPDAPPSDWLALLPHGKPFLFVTRVDEVRSGESARGVWVLDGSEPFFEGHFPGRPVVPGVLLAEALAQISGLTSGPEAGADGKLAHMDVRFEQSAVPPIEIELHAKLLSVYGPLHKCAVTAQVGSAILAQGTITLHRAVARGES